MDYSIVFFYWKILSVCINLKWLFFTILEVVGWPPCIRIIITESKACSSLVGKLFLITCPGGTIGRSTNRDVVVPDDNVSKVKSHNLF